MGWQELWDFRVNSFLLYHPAQDRFVYFYRVGVRHYLGNKDALPPFEGRWNQLLYCLVQAQSQLIWVIDDKVHAE